MEQPHSRRAAVRAAPAECSRDDHSNETPTHQPHSRRAEAVCAFRKRAQSRRPNCRSRFSSDPLTLLERPAHASTAAAKSAASAQRGDSLVPIPQVEHTIATVSRVERRPPAGFAGGRSRDGRRDRIVFPQIPPIPAGKLRLPVSGAEMNQSTSPGHLGERIKSGAQNRVKVAVQRVELIVVGFCRARANAAGDLNRLCAGCGDIPENPGARSG
jgi:hypothetical protein